MVEVSAEHGLADATVARVVARAGVSRRTFYELFEDREACFLAAFDEVVARASRHVLDAYDPEAGWAERLRLALTALLSFLDVERGAGWLLVVGSLGAGATALERRRRVLAQMIAFVDEGRALKSTPRRAQAGKEAKAGMEPPPLTAEGVVGGALSVVHARMVEDGRKQSRMVELVSPLVSMIVLPYLGAAAARKELERVGPRPRARVECGREDPLRELGMRLTYRTVRVLMAVAAAPGSSNREIGLAAGVADQGQISKLLARLGRLGLVRNEGLAPGKGAPNAWALTGKGAQVERAMSADDGRAVAPGSRSRQ
jgi:AcrR family transcriptional regulator